MQTIAPMLSIRRIRDMVIMLGMGRWTIVRIRLRTRIQVMALKLVMMRMQEMALLTIMLRFNRARRPVRQNMPRWAIALCRAVVLICRRSARICQRVMPPHRRPLQLGWPMPFGAAMRWNIAATR